MEGAIVHQEPARELRAFGKFHFRCSVMLFPNDQVRANIRAGINDVVKELSDVLFQHDVWVSASHPGVMSSFREAVASLFDDFSAEEVVENAAEIGYSREQASALKELLNALSSVVGKYNNIPDEDLIEKPEWSSVVALAKKFISADNTGSC